MQTAGLMMNDVWAHRILNARGVETARFERVPAEVDVLVESVALRHHKQERRYRPYLHVSGELRGVRPEPGYELPYGIDEITYSGKQGERVDAFYEFDDEQLTTLAAKGLFQEGFKVPESEITDRNWELPTTVDMLVLAPDPQVEGGNVPVIFTEVHDRADLLVTRENSGYDLAAYFHDHSVEPEVQSGVETEARQARTRSDELNPLFGEEIFERETRSGRERPVSVEAAPADDFGSRKEAIEAEIEAERERYATERAEQDGTVENVYSERVARSLRDEGEEEATRHDVSEPVSEQGPASVEPKTGKETTAPWTGEGDLDFGLEEDRVKVSHEKRKRNVSRAAAELTGEEPEAYRQY